MPRLDVFAAVEIRDSVGHFQDAVMGAGREPQSRNGISQQFSPSAEIARCLRIILGTICAFA